MVFRQDSILNLFSHNLQQISHKFLCVHRWFLLMISGTKSTNSIENHQHFFDWPSLSQMFLQSLFTTLNILIPSTENKLLVFLIYQNYPAKKTHYNFDLKLYSLAIALSNTYSNYIRVHYSNDIKWIPTRVGFGRGRCTQPYPC